MNNLVNYIKVNFARKQIIYLSAILLIIFNVSSFAYFLKSSHMKKQNWYDLIISMFSNYLVVAFFLFAVFCMLIYNVGSKKNFYLYILNKFKSRGQWYNCNVLQLLILAILYTLFIVGICFLEGINILSFNNIWSEYSISLSVDKPLIHIYDPTIFRYIINTISPLSYIIINISYIICYFFVIGMVYFIFSMYFKNKIFSFICLFVVNCVNIAAYTSERFYLKKLSLYHNFILLGTVNEHLSISMFFSRFIYWILIISTLYIIGNIIKSKIDFSFGES